MRALRICLQLVTIGALCTVVWQNVSIADEGFVKTRHGRSCQVKSDELKAKMAEEAIRPGGTQEEFEQARKTYHAASKITEKAHDDAMKAHQKTIRVFCTEFGVVVLWFIALLFAGSSARRWAASAFILLITSAALWYFAQ